MAWGRVLFLVVRILGGEPILNTLKTLDCKEAARAKPFFFRFES